MRSTRPGRVLWIACDLDQVPSYRLVHLRCIEIATRPDAFEQTAAPQIPKAEPRTSGWAVSWWPDPLELIHINWLTLRES